MSEGGSGEGEDTGGVGAGTLVSSDPPGLLYVAKKLDPVGGVYVCCRSGGVCIRVLWVEK